MTLPEITIQTESSDCAFAAMATLVRHFAGRRINPILLRNQYGEGGDGISIGGTLALLGRLGIEATPVKYSRKAVQQRKGLYLACEETCRAGHLTVLASDGRGRVHRANLITGRWHRVRADYTPSLLALLKGFQSTSAVADFSEFVGGGGRMRRERAVWPVFLNMLPSLAPFLVFVAVAEHASGVGRLALPALAPLAAVIFVSALRIFAAFAVKGRFARDKARCERVVLNQISGQSLDFFIQRHSYEVYRYFLDAEEVAKYSVYAQPSQASGIAASVLMLAMGGCLLPAPVVLAALFIMLGMSLSLVALHRHLDATRERQRASRNYYQSRVDSGIKTPLGLLYSKSPMGEREDIVKYSMMAARYEGEYQAKLELFQTTGSLLLQGITFGMAVFLAARIHEPTPSMLVYPFLIGIGDNVLRFVSATHRAVGEELALARINTLCAATPDRALRERHSVRDLPTSPRRIVIEGPNGAGKSIYLQCLAGLSRRWHLVKPRFRKRLEELRAALGDRMDAGRRSLYIPGSFIPCGQTVEDVIVNENWDPTVAAQVAERLGLSPFDDFRKRQLQGGGPALSKGEQQRLALLYAIMMQPDVLVLDESLSAVPSTERRGLLAYIVSEMEQACIVYVDHHEDAQGDMWDDRISLDGLKEPLISVREG
jgi:ABC-type Mn2+/Zn2+ transport system ATPase subunit